MSYTDHILKEDGWFTAEDKVLTFRVYAYTATQPSIEADTAATEVITGWALSYMLKRRRTDADADAVLTYTTGAGEITIVSPDASVSVPAEDTENLEEAVYFHELKRTDTGFNHVLCDGEVHLRRAVHDT